jgi:hypothetical protein
MRAFLFFSSFLKIYQKSAETMYGNSLLAVKNERQGMKKSKRENRKVGRVILSEPLRVVMCSIGAQVRYELVTQNISFSGFFLQFDSPGRFPFTPASIMEVWLVLDHETTLFFNGKMARVVHHGDPTESETGTGIAIQIVQIDKKNDEILRDFIESKHQEQREKTETVA